MIPILLCWIILQGKWLLSPCYLEKNSFKQSHSCCVVAPTQHDGLKQFEGNCRVDPLFDESVESCPYGFVNGRKLRSLDVNAIMNIIGKSDYSKEFNPWCETIISLLKNYRYWVFNDFHRKRMVKRRLLGFFLGARILIFSWCNHGVDWKLEERRNKYDRRLGGGEVKALIP